MTAASYEASTIIKRARATKVEMEERAEFLIDYANEHGPVTVRGLYYQAEVAGLPGIGKDDRDYTKIQRQVLKLRRAGLLAYSDIADATRWMRKPTTHNSVEEALENCAQLYRKNLWRDTDDYVEVWIEKDALAGVLYSTTALYDVPLMVTRGFSSETFAFEAVAAREGDDRTYYVYYLGDFDRAGRDAAKSLEEKLRRFADENGKEVVFKQIAVTERQIAEWNLPTREPKRKSAADKKWPHDFACELDAIPPDLLRDLVEGYINLHLPQDKLEVLKAAEQSEREILSRLVRRVARQ
jgi:hypothetical protein